jgi:HK97 family phage major capsid protein
LLRAAAGDKTMTLKELLEKMAALHAQARAIIKAGGEREGGLTPEDSAKVDALYAEYDKLEEQAKAIEKAANQARRLEEQAAYLAGSAGRQARPETAAPAAGPVETVEIGGRQIPVAANPLLAQLASPRYRDAFAGYLAGRGVTADLATNDNARGGYLAPVQLAARLITALDNEVFMRRLATVLPPLVGAVSLGIPTLEADPAAADWTAEVPASDITADTTMSFGKRELTPQLLTKLIKTSQKLLRTSVVDVENLIAERLSYVFGITEENKFLNGTGAGQPLGVFTASADGVTTSRDVTTTASADIAADDLFSMLYSLKSQYARNATWILHRDTLSRIRKLKGGDGQYLWVPGLAGNAATICDRPYVVSEYAPNTFTTTSYVAVLGDFRTGYWIADSLMLEVQRLAELFAAKNQVGFLGRKETDGMPVLAEAFARMKLL